MTQCFYHPDRPQTETCHACGKALCDSCTLRPKFPFLMGWYSRDLCPECHIKSYKNQKYLLTGLLTIIYLVFFIGIIGSDMDQKGLILSLIGLVFLLVVLFGIFICNKQITLAKLRLDVISNP